MAVSTTPKIFAHTSQSKAFQSIRRNSVPFTQIREGVSCSGNLNIQAA